MNFLSIEKAFDEATSQGVFPGAVVLVSKENEVLFERAFGYRSLVPAKTPMRLETIFDLASLTKPLATALAAMLLVREKKLRLDDRVTRFFPTFGVFGKHSVTFRQLLNHTSGLPSWRPYYETIIKDEKSGKINFVASRAAKNFVFEQIHREKSATPAGAECQYSDLGFMILGEVIEAIGGRALDIYCHEKIFKPLGLRSTSFVDLTQLRTGRFVPIEQMIAPTENCPWRKKILCGEVHDDNAYAMGGVAGHAGLFSSVHDLHLLLACLARCYIGKDEFLPQSLMEEFLSRDAVAKDGTYALGWDTPSRDRSMSGSHFSRRSVGHLGFTGTSVWWDLEKHFYVILLTNRVHPSRKNDKLREFRPYVHDLIMKTVFP
jgi:CubicO group peptidase (beta-lactamase class C family)